jgi:hypothetical protein
MHSCYHCYRSLWSAEAAKIRALLDGDTANRGDGAGIYSEVVTTHCMSLYITTLQLRSSYTRCACIHFLPIHTAVDDHSYSMLYCALVDAALYGDKWHSNH